VTGAQARARDAGTNGGCASLSSTRAVAAPMTQHSQAVHKVWLAKCAPLTSCAQPNNVPNTTMASSTRQARCGRARRHWKYSGRKAKAATAWPDGKHWPGPPSARISSQCGT
jgi:hypothetical protein